MTKSEYQESVEFLGVRFDQMQAQQDRRFDRIEARLTRLEGCMTQVKARLTKIEIASLSNAAIHN